MKSLAVFCLCFALAIWAVGPAMASHPPIAVIVHPENSAKVLSASDLEAIFTSNRRHWDGGDNIAAFNFPPKDPLRVTFDRVVLGMDPDEVGRYWIDRRIRGRRGPPRQIPKVSLMVRVVEKLPTAIGYAPLAESKKANVKIVARVKDGRVLPP